MIIKKAAPEDSKSIAPYLLLAMESIIYTFIGEKNPAKATEFLLYFIEKENNQYSYQNCWVVEDQNQIIAAVNIYDGEKLKELRKPVTDYINKQYGQNLNIEDETESGEYYIDTLGVNPQYQGKGIGSELLRFLIKEYSKYNLPLGLLVDTENPLAKKLYFKLGFESIGRKKLVGKEMEHLQIKPF
ncbi:GNAT family N-acetyltransferase [Flavobacterium sp. ARAG 55.4]|uniref:GNAT family N-acetyltransferase n=1 Tax=Flavobacterium sp. ARAG 55.4 TaxID=3451357 RepID=UPI003F47B424